MKQKYDIELIEKMAKLIRRNIVLMLKTNRGHLGGSTSIADIVASLYFGLMNFDPKKTCNSDGDHFVLSKGHVCPALYAILEEFGCLCEGEICTLRQPGSRLQGHPASDRDLPGIEISTGSLGLGLSVAVGMALGIKRDGKSNRVYCLMGDGEQQEGAIWEAAMSAGHFCIDNLCAIVDYNHLQIDGPVEDVMNIAPIADKYRAFNWNVLEINGHDLNEVVNAYNKAKVFKGKPTVIIADTIKGKGVSFMENKVDWHGKAPDEEQTKKALSEIESK